MLTVGVGDAYGEATIEVTSSAITLPKGSTSVSQRDWINAAGVKKANRNWAYTDWSGEKTIGSYGSIYFANAGDLNNADKLLQFNAQNGYIETTINSPAGVDVVIGYKVGGNSFTVSLTGAAEDVTGSSSDWSTMSISTTSTSATLKINKGSKKEGYVFKGWIVDGEDTSKARKELSIEIGTTGDKNFIPVWEEKTYSINYDLDGVIIPENKENPNSFWVFQHSGQFQTRCVCPLVCTVPWSEGLRCC